MILLISEIIIICLAEVYKLYQELAYLIVHVISSLNTCAMHLCMILSCSAKGLHFSAIYFNSSKWWKCMNALIRVGGFSR